MKDYKKQAQGFLFLTFLLGGLFGIIDNRNFELGNFIGSGLAIMCISILIGSTVHSTLKKLKIIENKSNLEIQLLDEEFGSEKLEAAKNKILDYLNKFRYSVYVALVIVIIAAIKEFTKF